MWASHHHYYPMTPNSHRILNAADVDFGAAVAAAVAAAAAAAVIIDSDVLIALIDVATEK